MTPQPTVNLQSLRLVQEELTSTVETSARNLENFVSSKQEDTSALQSSVEGIEQILGTFKLVELFGAVALTEELLKSCNNITSGSSGERFNREIEAISNTFFIITKYVEFILHSHADMPVLLMPHMNALRRLRGESNLFESAFIKMAPPTELAPPENDGLGGPSADLVGDVRRIRHMYHIGLAGLLREKQLNKALVLMRRSMKRLPKLCGSGAQVNLLWWLADLVLDAFSKHKLSVWETRKCLFVHLDRVLKQIESKGTEALKEPLPEKLVKELIYLVALNGQNPNYGAALNTAIANVSLPFSEQSLQKEHANLYGPSYQTIASLSQVLHTELNTAKRVLENSALHDSLDMIEDLDGFLSLLESVHGILGVVGLAEAADILNEKLSVVRGWKKDSTSYNQESVSSVAETLIYVDSIIHDINGRELNTLNGSGSGQGTDRRAQGERVASREFTTAIEVVIDESLNALLLTKRAMNSFVDSGYDVGHIKNIAKILGGIRGAMSLLKQDRVASILEGCVEFVEEILIETDPPATINEIMETFADAIMSVEYYLDSASSFDAMDEAVLVIAEDSLTALGFGYDAD